jgi:hypothetical protein
MALPTGTITINDLATEYGGSTPHSLSEYYRSLTNAAYVNDYYEDFGYSRTSGNETYLHYRVPTNGDPVSYNWWWGGAHISGLLQAPIVVNGIEYMYVTPYVETEYGGKDPNFYNDYFYQLRRRQPRNQGVPTAGTLSLDDFRGESGN